MQFFYKRFPKREFTLYPLGDFHYGSAQCNIKFIKQAINEVKDNPNAYWIGMGDMMENAIVGSKSDVYTQTIPPKQQMDDIIEMLTPIKDKGLFLIAGNHEQRTVRQVGLIPEQHIAYQLQLPYMGFSCFTLFQMSKCKSPGSFKCYFHHNYGGGYTMGGKVNRADKLRLIAPTVDAIFCGHFHITSRIPITWYDTGRKKVIKHTGYDYITGSALEYADSYAEEKGKPSAAVEFIKVIFRAGVNGRRDGREQIYQVITPKEK